VKLVGKADLKLVSEQPEKLEQLTSLTRLLPDNEDNEIRRGRLKLAEKYFDDEATAACQDELPKLRSYLKVFGEDERLSHDEKLERIQIILFGRNRAEPNRHESNLSRNGD
jgi:hypothetical protein